MKQRRHPIAKTPSELAAILGLAPAESLEIEIRADLNRKIIEVVKELGLTHAQVAHLAKTSRTRITALLNRNTIDISTDLMLRVLGSLGVKAKIQFKKPA